MEIIEVTNKLVINYRSSERVNGRPAWCELPYPGHKKGCPNYERCSKLPRIGEYFDLTKPHWFAVIPFNLHRHVSKMINLHPKWSERQCRCVLYWQNGVKSQLDTFCQFWIWGRGENLIWHKIPEAMGVNVMLTMKRMGQPIEIKPKFLVRKIALIGTAKNNTYKGDKV